MTADRKMPSPAALLGRLNDVPGRGGRLVHTEHVPARPGVSADWPAWADPHLVERLSAAGVRAPWLHQVEAAEHAHDGRAVVVATGTASGKSLAYLLPALSAVRAGSAARDGRGSTALYLAPTKALAADQLRAVQSLGVQGVRAATYDGDTATAEREWVRAHASYVLSNPDLLHRSLLPGHPRWAAFLRALDYVVVDECHVYRGVFGSHVAAVLRRLRRVCVRYGSSPVFVLASATVCDPAASAERLVGMPVVAVTGDSCPRGELAFGLWEPPLTQMCGENGAPVRRSVHAETADLLTDLVVDGRRTIAFVRSRRGAETVALVTRAALDEVQPGLGARVAAYRAGYLPEERRALEADLQSGRLLAVAATSALELGVDVAGLDVVLLAGWPGTRASLWQQAGRAGRAGQGALAVLVARDDPLDTYLVHHPEAIFGQPVEATVLDPTNPYVLRPHLCAAAAELPLTEQDLPLFGPGARSLLDELVEDQMLRRRPGGWYWTLPRPAADLADLRGIGGTPVRVVEPDTGRLLGTVDPGSADLTVHAGAVYLHQGQAYLVESLDLHEAVALASPARPDYSTHARQVTDIRIVSALRTRSWGAGQLTFGDVEVTARVVSFLRRRLASGEVLGEEPLDLPARQLVTRCVWWTLPEGDADAAGVAAADLPGAAHAAGHAAIGLLPLFATCDRWDIGGVSTARHPDTGLPTVFVHDAHPGGAGFAERGYEQARQWLQATCEAIACCGCDSGCPSCVQSPKCGNGNHPLDKDGAVRLLRKLLSGAPDS